METKRIILARFVDFDVTQTNALPWQPDVRFFLNSLSVEDFLEKHFWQLFASILHFPPFA